MKRMVLAMTFAAMASAVVAAEPYQLDSSELANVEAGIRSKLTDPESAKFDGVSASKSASGTVWACGYVNAKNQSGGYVGQRPFIGFYRSGNFVVKEISRDKASAQAIWKKCRKIEIRIKFI
jgi:hypothetical protein